MPLVPGTMKKYKGVSLLQKSFTKDFLTNKRVDNNGKVPQYYGGKTPL